MLNVYLINLVSTEDGGVTPPKRLQYMISSRNVSPLPSASLRSAV